MELEEKRDFFISYTHEDKKWAIWVADVLERNGYKVYIQDRDTPKGLSFVQWMAHAIQHSSNFIAICSHAYFNHDTEYAIHELETGYSKKMRGEIRLFLLVRVDECSIPDLYSNFVRFDIFDAFQDEETEGELIARRLLCTVREERYQGAPSFPVKLIDKESICRLGELYLYKETESELKLESNSPFKEIAFQCFDLSYRYRLEIEKAAYYLGHCFEYGYGVPRNDIKARQYYEEAQDMGSIEAYYADGVLYEQKRGLQKRDHVAIEGSVSQHIARIIQYGEPYLEMIKDEMKSHDFISLLTIKDDEVEMRDVLRRIVEESYCLQHALLCYEKASSQGHALASRSLGRMYQSGKGVKQNYEKARSYYQKAFEQGDKSALQEIQHL